MSTKKFAEEVVKQFCLELTDQLFLYIENDKKLMQEYLRLVSSETLHKTNQDLGREFKELFNVETLKENQDPKSKLIKFYTQHTIPNITPKK